MAASGFFTPLIAILILFAALAVQAVGQDEQPLIVPRKTLPQANKKPRGKEPRAVGVVQLNGSKGTLIPIAILINGRFYDASAYKADPIPMALGTGIVYEVEQGGDSQGIFTVNGALHSKSPGSAHPWVGTGSYLPPGTEAAKDRRKAEDVPVGLSSDNGDEPPRLTKKISSKPGDSSAGGGSTAGTGDKSSGTGTASSGSGSGGSTTGSSGDASKPSAAPAGDKGSDGKPASAPVSAPTSAGRPTSGKPTSTQPTEAAPSGGGAGENYYRPTLRRGKPTTQAPPDEADTVAAKKVAEGEVANSAAVMNGEAVKLMTAISDAAGPEPQSYKFFWKEGEKEERRDQMVKLAQGEVRAYAAALVKNQIVARPSGSKTVAVKGKTTAKQAEPVLENVQFRGFDMWLTNQLVMILSAEAHLPGAASTAPESYSVTVVARTDIYGNLQKLYSGVTDRFHLDVTPRLELIDVVDADGDGRGELLFRETSDAGNGYLIYRATADRLWKMFDSLNAE
ncbi:MAG: hypothetical protein ABR874_08790 [Candidatus Sulfotelmatobacter sp.]